MYSSGEDEAPDPFAQEQEAPTSSKRRARPQKTLQPAEADGLDAASLEDSASVGLRINTAIDGDADDDAASVSSHQSEESSSDSDSSVEVQGMKYHISCDDE